MGLGKTIQMTTLSYINPLKCKNLIDKDKKQINSKKQTLIL